VVGAVIVIVVIAAVYFVLTSSTPDETNGEENNGNTFTTANPVAVIDTTMGEIQIELYQDKTPATVDNFIQLATDGFYDGVIFHRIKDDFMIQAGLQYPDGSTKESPYGSIAFESDPDVSHVDGAISMASTAAGVGGSAQFFICDGAQSFLDGSYAAFGVVIEGIEVVRDIAAVDHDGSLEPNPGGGKPVEDIIINSITIENLE